MIFKTKNNELAIFGNTLDDVKTKWDNFNQAFINSNGQLFGENGALSAFFSGKSPKPILDDKLLGDFEVFKDLFNQSSLSAEVLAEDLGGVDDAIVDYAKNCKNGELTTEGFKASLKGMSLSAKAGQIALQGLAIAGNMLAMWAISKGIEFAVKSFDEYIHRVEYAKEALDESQSAYDTVTSELADLNEQLLDCTKKMQELENTKSIDNLVDDEAYQELKTTADELDRLITLKKEEQRLKAIQLANDAEDLYNTNVDSKYKEQRPTGTLTYKEGYETSMGQSSPTEELQLALEHYKEYAAEKERIDAEMIANAENRSKLEDTESKEYQELLKIYTELERSSEDYGTKMDDASLRANEMYQITNGLQEAYDGLIDGGKDLNATEQERYEIVDNVNGLYLEFLDKQQEANDSAQESAQELKATIDSLTPFSKSEMISQIKSISSGFEAIDKFYKDVKDGGTFDFSLFDDKDFSDTFSGFKEEYSNFIETVSDSPNDIKACQSAFDDLVSVWINSTGILDHVDEGNAKVTASMLELMGVENADILVSQALAQRKAELSWQNEQVHASTANEIQALAEECGITGEAKDAFYAYYAQKLIAENAINTNGDIEALGKIIDALGLATSAWKTYYAAKREMEAMSKPENQYTNAAGEKYYEYIDENGVNHIASQWSYDQKQKSLESKQKALEAEWEAKFSKPTTGYSGGNKSNSSSGDSKSSGSGSSSSSEKIYDWTEQALKRVSAENDKIREQVDDTNLSYDKRLSLQKQLLESNQDELEIMKTVNQRKVENWEQARDNILATFGEEEGNDYISKILYGNIDKDEWLDKIKDEAHKKLIDTAITANEELEESNNKLTEIEKRNAEDIQKGYEMQKNEIKALVDEVQTSIDSIQSSISIRETSGTEIITEADYRSLISHSKEQISLYEEQLDVLEDQLDTLDEGSAEWYDVKSQIASCEASINDCVEAQAEWNEEIKKLPIRRVERYLELLENIKTDITNFQAEQDVLGINATKEQYQELVSITEEQIKKLLEKHKELEKNLSTYTYGTDAFNECSNSIQDVENNISDLIQEMREYNNQILQIPINKIEELNEQLSNVNSALAEIGEDYSTTVNTVTDAIDHQIESIEDLKTAEEEAAQVKIDALQEQLDLLESQNEERKVQLALEQAEYNLERAKNQKTNQVVRNGEIVYEADQDDLRDAQQNLADAQYDKLTHDIETQIEQIEENRDAMIENYDAEIDRLEKISEKWSEIEHNIEDAKNAVIADDILGTGWKDKVFSGNDQDIYDKFVSEYEANLNQQDSYTKLIEQNEKISALMQQYIDAYNDGSITYEEAVKQFTAVQNAAKDGLTSEEYLNALLKISGDKDVDSALKNVQTEVSGAYSDFKSYFDAVNKNSETIASYTSTWEEIRDAVVEQLETLKKLAEEEAKKVAEAKSSSSGRKHSSGGGSSTKWDSRDENNGPGREINDRAAGITSSSSSSSSSSSPSGPASDPDLKARKRKSGIETGIVGKDTSNSNAETVRMLALDKLKSDEEPAILHRGEVVLNEVQMKNIVDNFRTALIHPINLPQVTIPNIARQQPNITIEMKDFNFNEVDNVRDFCDEMQRNFDPIMTQYFSKK